MLLGKIKIATLKLMFETNIEERLTIENLAGYYNDDTYSEILRSMPEAINRAIDRFKVNGLLKSEDGFIISETELNNENTESEQGKVTYIDDNTADTAELDIPEILCRMIPYFVKAELMEDDDMVKANLARNIFENNLAEYIQKRPDRLLQKEITIIV